MTGSGDVLLREAGYGNELRYFGLHHDGLTGSEVSALSVINPMVTIRAEQKNIIKSEQKTRKDILDARGCSSTELNCFKLIQ